MKQISTYNCNKLVFHIKIRAALYLVAMATIGTVYFDSKSHICSLYYLSTMKETTGLYGTSGLTQYCGAAFGLWVLIFCKQMQSCFQTILSGKNYDSERKRQEKWQGKNLFPDLKSKPERGGSTRQINEGVELVYILLYIQFGNPIEKL